MILVRTHDLLRNKHFQAIFSKLMLNCCQAIVIEDGGISIAIRTSTFYQVPDEVVAVDSQLSAVMFNS